MYTNSVLFFQHTTTTITSIQPLSCQQKKEVNVFRCSTELQSQVSMFCRLFLRHLQDLEDRLRERALLHCFHHHTHPSRSLRCGGNMTVTAYMGVELGCGECRRGTRKEGAYDKACRAGRISESKRVFRTLSRMKVRVSNSSNYGNLSLIRFLKTLTNSSRCIVNNFSCSSSSKASAAPKRRLLSVSFS
jgi:hypothetical protein